MHPAFVPARELKRTYSVFGHFYEVALSSEQSVHCRSVLEIFAPRAMSLIEARRGFPDALFIMMNPGSSRPLEGHPATFHRSQPIPLRKSLVPTRPDTTQYQVMRVMVRLGWNHVRVLNLSDLREPKSAMFLNTYRFVEQSHDFKNHSIFARSRRKELESELRRKSQAPLICAWGVSQSLAPLISAAVPLLESSGTCQGLPKPGALGKYFHPLPTLQSDKEAWVSNTAIRQGSLGKQSLRESEPCRLTPPSSGRPKAGCASFVPPLMSNVRREKA